MLKSRYWQKPAYSDIKAAEKIKALYSQRNGRISSVDEENLCGGVICLSLPSGTLHTYQIILLGDGSISIGPRQCQCHPQWADDTCSLIRSLAHPPAFNYHSPKCIIIWRWLLFHIKVTKSLARWRLPQPRFDRYFAGKDREVEKR